MEKEMILHLAEGIVVLILIVFIAVYSVGETKIVNVVQANLSPEIVISMVNEKVPPGNFGPVTIPGPTIIGSSYFYRITTTPKLELTSTEKSSVEPRVDVISIIEFKGQSIRATVKNPAGDSDKFTITTDEIAEPVLAVELSTAIPPIVSVDSPYSQKLMQGAKLLIKGDDGPILASVSVDRSYHIFENAIDSALFNCLAIFELECKSELRYSSYLKVCKSDGKPSDCEESIGLCGGTAHIKISDTDCSEKSVYLEDLSYKGGTKWDAGEKVGVSFWRDTECTRRTTEFRELLVTCPKDRLGGEFELNAGIIQL